MVLYDSGQVVVGSKRSGIESEFHESVDVECCPRSRWGRLTFAVSRLVRLLGRGSLELVPFWNYLMKAGRQKAFGRLLYAIPILLHRPEIVHVQWAKSLHRAMELRDLFSFAVVLSLRGTHISSSPLGDVELLAEYRQDFPKVHAFHAVCRAIKADAIALGARSDRIRVIYSGVDCALVEAPLEPLREDLRPLRVLSVGRIHWRKGYHRALDAVAQLAKSRPVEYRIIAGPPDDELLLQMNDLQVGGIVHFEPAVPRQEVLEQMRHHADLLLVPSMGEGIANVAIEAMAVGLPVLVTRCGGMPELVQAGSGLLCDPWDTDSMAEALGLLAEMPLQERDELRKTGRRYIAENRRLDDLVREMHLLYEEAIQNQCDDH